MIGELAGLYAQAWSARDIDAIVALHTEHSTLHVRGLGSRAQGREEIRAAVDAFFATWSVSRFAHRSVLLGDGYWVVEWTVHATGAGALTVAQRTIDIAGKEVSFEGVDVVRVSEGLVSAKDSYIDGVALLAQLTS